MSFRLFFAWFDLWVGAYYDRSEGVLYVCPLPCVVLMFWRRSRGPLATWANEQQTVAEASVRHNATCLHVLGCIKCGRLDTLIVYHLGRADEPQCADRRACAERERELWS